MRNTREILRFKWGKGLAIRQIARSLNISHSTVKDHLARAELAGLSWPLPEGMTDAALEELLFPSKQSRKLVQQPDFAYIHKELRKKGVTLELLWTEYKRENPDGYHYAEASLSQDLPSWISAHCRALAFIGGVPSLIVPDNTKTAVVKPDYYEPSVHATYQEFADHYGTVILPARTKKPKDKAKAEGGVKFSENWLLAPLRNLTFFSLFELNQTLRLSLEDLNQRPFQKLEGTRKTLFEVLDKPALKPLPDAPYEFGYWKKAKVNIDCHIQVENNFYSVPYKFVQKQVDVRITATTVEVFFKGERISSHLLCHGRGKYATDSRHFSPAHRWYLE